MAADHVLERERQEKRRMEELLRAHQVALQQKGSERSMLKRKKQGMIAKEAPREKLVDDFMVFIGAIENNDLENAQKFDEKAMMNDIFNMIKSYYSENGGFAGNSNVLGIDLDLEEKATMDAIEALVNNIADCGGGNGGFAGGHGGINDAVENANNLGQEGLMTPTDGTNSDGREGSNAGGYDGSNRRN
ncbi:hypothetical protein DITRI_Ditri20bG0052200 [Diplodiscus trichospermus]